MENWVVQDEAIVVGAVTDHVHPRVNRGIVWSTEHFYLRVFLLNNLKDCSGCQG
jgi:hypothetical protein